VNQPIHDGFGDHRIFKQFKSSLDLDALNRLIGVFLLTPWRRYDYFAGKANFHKMSEFSRTTHRFLARRFDARLAFLSIFI